MSTATLPAETTVLAYFERRVGATYVPHRSVVEFIASAMVQADHNAMRPVEDFLADRCYAFDEAQEIDDDALLWGRGVYAQIRIFNGCPGGGDHQCREQGRPRLLTALRSTLATS